VVRSQSTIATPPGATIREQLTDRGMSQKEFASRMDMSQKHISRLINGEVQLTPETALKLEMVLGVPAGFWNNLEAIYREKIVKVEAENDMDYDLMIMNRFPYGEMARLEWVPDTRIAKERVVYLRKYFEVAKLSLLDNKELNSIACRRLAITEKSDLALMAWAQEAKRKARDISTSPLNIKGLLEYVPDLRNDTLLRPDEFCPRIKSDFADRGIALVFLPNLKGALVRGASFTDGTKIVMGITLAGGDADRFWFSLFHELAHVVLGHVGRPDGTSQEDEKAADKWSEDALISADAFEVFKANMDYSEKSIINFANAQGIATGIVVGRMQKEGLIKHNAMNELKTKYDIAG